MNIENRVHALREKIIDAAKIANRNPEEITLMAVTKTVSPEYVNEAISAGITLLGESRAQDLVEKYPFYHKGVDIHFIGSLQRNKVRYIVDKVSMIHSVDSLSLAKEINQRSQAIDKVMNVLIQVNIGEEETKSGILAEDVLAFAEELKQFPNLRLRGLMAIPPICDSEQEEETYFLRMKRLLVDIQQKNSDNSIITVLSIGMSGDYVLAIRQGATIIRIGTAIFGDR